MISKQFKATLTKSNGEAMELALNITLSYDEDFDPFAVQMIVSYEGAEGSQDAVWWLDRGLMIRCLATPGVIVGFGDFRLRLQPGMIKVCLKNDTGHADLRLPVDPVKTFLAKTELALPLGAECVDEQIDDFLAEVFNP